MSPVTSYLVETLLTLGGVGALALLLLVGGRRIGLGRASGPLELLGRLALDPRRAVYVVRAGKHVYVLGGSEGGLVPLGELDPESLPGVPPPDGAGPAGFRSTLARVLGRQDPSPGAP